MEEHLTQTFTTNGWVLATLAFATIIGGLAAIDQFCQGCLRKDLKHIWQSLFSSSTMPPKYTSGPVPLDSPFYVEPYEGKTSLLQSCYADILKPAALLRIKAPRQMGKTSLMNRILQHAQQQGYRVVSLSFEEINAEVFANLDTFLQHFCATATEKLHLPPFDPSHHWHSMVSCNLKCGNYCRDHLLLAHDQPLVLAIDEVDRIFGYPEVAGEFFAILRAWVVDGQGGIHDTWKRLRLIITHSQEVYASLPVDLKQSPFNVGRGISLPEFTEVQVLELAKRHQLNWTTTQVESLMMMIGGHPYLVQTALTHIASQTATLEQFLKLASTDQGVYYDHLHRHLITLRERPALATAMRRVVLSEKSVRIDDDDKFKLRSLGLVTFQGDEVMPLCGLYRQYFRTHLTS